MRPARLVGMKRTLRAVAAMSKTSIAAITLIALVPSCATSKEVPPGPPALGGLMTVSALMVALPFAPVLMPIGIVQNIHETKVEKQLRDVLDTEYAKRITLIQARDPIADATQAWSAGAKAFLPSAPGGDLFPGIEDTELNAELNSNKQFGSENYARVQKSEFLRSLETLLSEDPLQVQHRNVPYFSQTYKRFVQVCWNYRQAFNHEMWRRYVSPEKSP